MFVFRGDLVLSLFGPRFTAAHTSLIILSFSNILNVAAGPVGWLLLMTGHERDAALGVFVATLVSLFLNVLLVGSYGIEGAALATAIGMVIWNLLLMLFVWRRLKLHSTILSDLRSWH